MIHRILLFASGFWLLASGGFAQQLPLSNQYTVNKFALSPAYAGTGDAFEIFGTYRKDWANVAAAPEYKVISANGMCCKNMGFGGMIASQKAGIFENLSASASYAYHAKLSGEHILSFGLSLGLLESHINLAGAAGQMDDPVVLNNANVNSMVFDTGFGILYRFKNLHAGISLPRMLSSKIKNSEGTAVYTLAAQQQFNIGYKYSINKDWVIDPLVKVSMVKNVPAFYEVAIPVIYKNTIWVAPIYKKTSMAFGLGGKPYDNFIAQYSYEFSSSGIMGQSGGTHEITIGWRMHAKKKSEVPAPDKKKPYFDWILK
ncbi:MAG: PorP/SprF family type IX secretion system membrane protein [Bacteroidetes bacterium]|nr:PorP/SprF family type IX secretion system membrane protein [Bacteroidota bacterium]